MSVRPDSDLSKADLASSRDSKGKEKPAIQARPRKLVKPVVELPEEVVELYQQEMGW